MSRRGRSHGEKTARQITQELEQQRSQVKRVLVAHGVGPEVAREIAVGVRACRVEDVGIAAMSARAIDNRAKLCGVVLLCRPHGRPWLTCADCSKVTRNGRR